MRELEDLVNYYINLQDWTEELNSEKKIDELSYLVKIIKKLSFKDFSSIQTYMLVCFIKSLNKRLK